MNEDITLARLKDAVQRSIDTRRNDADRLNAEADGLQEALLSLRIIEADVARTFGPTPDGVV